MQWFEAPFRNHDGHTDYQWAYVGLRTSHVNGSAFSYHHSINHETGHALGLRDPNFTGHCMNSVMHSAYYGCTDREWPSPDDRDVVASLAELVPPPVP